MKLTKASLLSLLILPGLARGEAGYSSANFLKIGVGARAAAMADSFTAVADDSTALYWNPAGLALVPGTSFSTTHGQWLQGVTNDYFTLSQQLGPGTLGIGYENQGVQSFSSTLENASGGYAGTGSTVSASDWALSAAYGTGLDRFFPDSLFKDTYAGLKASMVGQNAINAVGNAISFDLGFLKFLPQQRLTIGLDIQNVGTSIQDRAQPVLFKAGLSWFRPGNFTSGDKWILSADADIHDDTGFHPSFGTEYRAPMGGDFAWALRAGLQATDNLYGFSGFTFGAGLEKGFNGFAAGLDYAFAPYGAVGDTNRFTLNLRLEAPQEKTALNPLDQGLSYMNQGQLDKALKLFQQESAKDPNNPKVKSLMGTCLFRMGQLPEAQPAANAPAPVLPPSKP